jgi:hypothetical protein
MKNLKEELKDFEVYKQEFNVLRANLAEKTQEVESL